MVLGTRETISAGEEKLLRLIGPVNNLAAGRKQRKNPQYAQTLEQLCKVAQINTERMPAAVAQKLSCKVSSVARAGSRFTKNCICVQFHEDNDQLMYWAMEHGALCCITRNQVGDLPCIVVDDPVEAYARMCKYFRDLSELEVTAVVGSIGKTTTKRMISAVYAAQYATFSDPENENQIDCVGYICQHLPRKAVKLVQEVSEDTPGCLQLISQMLSPRIVVVTAVDKSHIEAFGSEDKILEEIASVTKGMPDDGVAVVNIDDENTKHLICDRAVVTVSMEDPGADYYAADISLEEDGLAFYVTQKATGQKYPVKLRHVYARHNIYSALYAFAAGVLAGVEYDNILKGLQTYRAVGIRQNVYQARGAIVYADCYNAVARSMRSAIEAVQQIPVRGRRIAVLGDIEEAGDFSEQIHAEVLRTVDGSDFELLLLYGEKMARAAGEVKTRDSLKVLCCQSKSAISEQLKNIRLQGGDIILFKSSRKSALEDVIKQTWPMTYRREMLEYYWPIIKWRLKVIFS